MRVRDELVEIDATALRFDLAETRRFLVELGGLHLDRGEVADLRDSTDGWVAALHWRRCRCGIATTRPS
ncbi:hypothetical protein FXW78_49865 [Rhodococcus opacus]|nr:hypothetical protein [Rhodococcus opacus]